MDCFKLTRHRLRTVLTLSPHDWWMLVQTWTLLLAVDLGLRVLPLRRVQALLSLRHKDARYPYPAELSAVTQHLWRLVDIAARHHLYRMTCLRRSVVLQWLLRRRGIPADLRIGVRKESEVLRAHAWLEVQAKPIGDPETIAACYAPLVTWEADR